MSLAGKNIGLPFPLHVHRTHAQEETTNTIVPPNDV